VILGIGLVLVSGLLMAADDGPENGKEFARLEGVWRFALVEVNGMKQPEAPFDSNKLLVLPGGRYVIVQGTRITHGVIKLDPAKSPKHYDVTVTNGPSKGLSSFGVYEIDGDTWKVCLPLRGKDRPAAVASSPGNGCLFTVFKREKDGVKHALTAVGRMELAGTWQAVSYALDGKEATSADMQKVQLIIDGGGNAKALNEGKVFVASVLEIDPIHSPTTMDLTFTEGDSKGKKSLGIYKIEDNLLTICRAAPDKPRPTAFSSKPDSGQTLMTYRREKAAAK
jgi:uncharacterized protein (TIGR03067 family)